MAGATNAPAVDLPDLLREMAIMRGWSHALPIIERALYGSRRARLTPHPAAPGPRNTASHRPLFLQKLCLIIPKNLV